eukprot:gene10119-12411_t
MVKLTFGKSKKKDEDPNTIDKAFVEVLDGLGMPETEKNNMMRFSTSERKQQLIRAYKNKKFNKTDFSGKKSKRTVNHSPQYFADGLKAEPTKDLLNSLRVRLGNQPLKWLKEFISIDGVSLLINVLNANEIKATKTQDDIFKIAQCLHSLKLIMNTKVGLEAVVRVGNSINSIALIMDTPHLKTRIMASEMLAALCVLHSKGHALVLAGMENYREVKREKKPFIHLIQGLKNPSGSLQAVTFALINTLISSSSNVDDRIRIRDQFKRIGIQTIIEELGPEYPNNPDLSTQRDLYEQESRWDEQEQMENIRGDISEENPESIYRCIKERTQGGPLFPPFISILKLLLKTVSDDDNTDDQNLSNYLFVEKILTKINGGSVPNDGFSNFFGEGIDISHVSSEKAVLIQKEIEDLKKQKKRDAEKLHEKDILLTKLAKRLKRLEEAIRNGKGMEVLAEEEDFDLEKAIGSGMVGGDNKRGGVSSGVGGGESGEGSHLPDNFMRAKAPSGTSDFLSGFGDDGSGGSGGTTSAGGIPAGGAPPPPPPPPGGKLAPSTPERCTRAPSIKLKSYQWTKYRTRNIPNTFWTKVNYTKYNECLPYEQIETLFAAAVVEKKEKEQKKGDITVIDPKRAQNLGILLSRFKNITYDQIYDAIINLDETILDLECINQLIKYIPSKEEIDVIRAFKKSQEEKPEEERLKLGKAELFIDKISDIPRLTQRIQSLHFKLNFPEKLYQAKPDIRKFNEAMNDLQNNKLFAIMELILSIGNFINHGTNRGNASGFKIDSINKLADTKSGTREKYNLVHYLIEYLEATQPDLLTFVEEIPSVIEAATLSFSTSTSEIRLLRSGLNKLEKEIFGNSTTNNSKEGEEEKPKEEEGEDKEKTEGDGEEKKELNQSSASTTAKVEVSPLDDNDPFRLKLSEFLLSSKTELSDAESLIGETEVLYAKICKFFGEESNKIQPEEFLAVFKRFSDTFQLSRKDLERERSLKERADKRKTDKKSKELEKKKSKLEILSKVNLKPVGNNRHSTGSVSGSGSEFDDEDVDDQAIKEYINSVRSGDSPHSGDLSSGSDGEGMMDNVLNLIRDGDFRTIRRNHLLKVNRPKIPKQMSKKHLSQKFVPLSSDCEFLKMSSRAVRKIKSTTKKDEDHQDDILNSDEEVEKKVKVKSFSMLNLDSEEDEDDDKPISDNEEEEDEEEEEEEIKDAQPVKKQNKKQKQKQQQSSTSNNNNKQQPPKQQQQQQAKSNSKKSNNKKKQQKNSKKEDEDIDKIFKEIESSSTTSTTTTTTTSTIKRSPIDNQKHKEYVELFKIDQTCLSPANELKKLFGCKISDLKDLQKKKNPQLGYQQYKKKHFVLVHPKPEWPDMISSMYMELDSSEYVPTNVYPHHCDRVNYFKMKWGETYKQLQEEFYYILTTHDPMSIANLLRIHPYHIDSLLQLSQVCLQTADFQNAGDFVERAVFAFECNWSPQFNPTLGNSRLEYKHPENQTCFLSIFRYIQILGRRGCSRTALEFCKVLLSMDYNDPLFVRLIIDYYALKSKQYQFLLDLYLKVKMITPTTQPLNLLPNFSYSAALAAFMLNNENKNELLQNALISFPMVLKPLLEKMKTNLTMVKDGKMIRLEDDSFFNMDKDQLHSIQHLISLFVERNHPLWQQNPEIIEWLKENAKIVLEKVKSEDPIIKELRDPVTKEYSTINQEIFDHLVLSEYSDVIQRLPPDVIEMMRGEGFQNIDLQRDEFPQHQQPQQPRGRGIGQGYQIYRRRVNQQQQQIHEQIQQQLLQQQQQFPPVPQNHNEPVIFDNDPHYENAGNPLLHFFQSLIPWNDPRVQQQRQLQREQREQNPERGFLDDYIDMEFQGDDDDDDENQNQN